MNGVWKGMGQVTERGDDWHRSGVFLIHLWWHVYVAVAFFCSFVIYGLLARSAVSYHCCEGFDPDTSGGKEE